MDPWIIDNVELIHVKSIRKSFLIHHKKQDMINYSSTCSGLISAEVIDSAIVMLSSS
jgi:hypothetical protein